MNHGKKPRIRAILSDWGKVVVDFDNSKVGRELEKHSSSFNASALTQIQFEELRETFDAYMRGKLTTDGYRKVMKRALQLTCTDEAFDRAFTDVFTPNEPVIELWKSLRAKGVRMVAASNVEELRHARLIELGVHDLFDRHCLSYQAGFGKPDDRFFDHALGLANVAEEEALFVDDHPNFVEVAERHGMYAYAYDFRDHAAFERFLDGFEFAPYRSR